MPDLLCNPDEDADARKIPLRVGALIEHFEKLSLSDVGSAVNLLTCECLQDAHVQSHALLLKVLVEADAQAGKLVAELLVQLKSAREILGKNGVSSADLSEYLDVTQVEILGCEGL